MIRATELAYLAGIVDARATVILREMGKHRPYLEIAITVTRTPDVGDFLTRCVSSGTLVYQTRPAQERYACRAHCKTAHEHVGESTSVRWRMTGLRVLIMLHNLEPYLSRWALFEDKYNTVMESWMTDPPVGALLQSRDETNEHMVGEGWEIPAWLTV